MGCRNREISEDDGSFSSSLSEALLFATMCLIGLPVEVHVKDGSVYSGIFHTASLENQYGVVLKKARMTKKGKRSANVDNGVIIDTLIVLSGDLVQIVATEVLLPADSFSKNLVGDYNKATANVPSSLLPVTEVKPCMESFKEESRISQTRDLVQNQNEFGHSSLPTVTGKHYDVRKKLQNSVENDQGVAQQKMEKINYIKLEDGTDAAINLRHDQDKELKGKQEDHGQEFDFHKGVTVDGVKTSIKSVASQLNQVNPQDKNNLIMASRQLLDGVSNGPAPALVKIEKQCIERSISTNTSLNAYSVGVSTSSHSTIDSSMDSYHGSTMSMADLVPSHGSEPNKSGKDFKLNPRAKLFSPSVVNTMPATPAAPMVASVAYISNNPPVLPVAVAQPEVEFSPFVPRSSMSAKFVPYGSSITGYGGNGAQFSQPMVGHVGTRTQPLRYVGGQYPLQTGPTYGPSNSQAVMVGRFGQLVYVHPVSHDLAQGATVVSPVSPCPLLTTQPAQFPKHQGGTAAAQALQFCVPPPFMASGHQPLAAVPNHIPILQPAFPLNRAIQVPGSNALFSSKFT